jgi:hypothetical protein
VSDLIALATPRRQARAEQHLVWLAGGTLTLYTAPQPATPDDAITTQTALIVYELTGAPGTAEDGVITGAEVTAGVITGGAPTWGRARDAGGDPVGDYAVGLPGSGAAVQIASLALEAGDFVPVVSFTIYEG